MDISCWVVTEGIAGTENQCLGVSEALGLEARVIKLSLREPWKSLSPWLGCECACTFSPSLEAPWPDLLISSGRKSIAAARYIQRKSKGKTFSVHIQDPRCDSSNFDLVVVPHHDSLRGKHVMVTDTAPNRITDQKLAHARKTFPHLNNMQTPRVAVLIGGKSKAYDMRSDDVDKLILQLKKLQKGKGVSLMISASRRTGADNMTRLQNAFPEDEHTVFWNGEGDNPYMAYLAMADYILVTADSVSMISDALSTGTPTYIIPLPGGGRRIDLFHKHIIEKKLARPFNGTLEPYSYEKVCESARIAAAIRNKMHLRDE